ncbi:Nuclear protein localization protein 4 -like protein [Halotydeus destructor]|nr:Nuclear protein localization protein 4 -like protein [Halotydeus destructor]
MILRVQSPVGMKRIQVEPHDTAALFMQRVKEAFELDAFSSFNVYKNRNNTDRVLALEKKSIAHYELKNGDVLYLQSILPETSGSSSINNNNNGVVSTPVNSSTEEDEVDKLLWKSDGLIERPRDERLCRHGPTGKCLHCIPVEPYDEAYLKEHNIKHMSFQSYLRKLTRGIDKGKFAMLENISCRIKEGCKEHLPWPAGICTKCQPNAITLNRQVYRHVDNVVFENSMIVDRFLNYWRSTGHQRIGFLFGHYEVHNDVPLGVKATVSAIYEPPQESSRDHVKLILPDKNEALIDEIAAQLGLTRVGWVFTDLITDDIQKGTVKNLRNIETHFLTAQECVMAGYFQNKYPNPCRLSPEGSFGSKFATVCITGDKENQIHMEGYQVSNQCMALVRDNCLLPTKDAPELGYVRETSKEQYVPDVFFKEKDSFGNEVMRIGRPLPIEYLLVDVPASTPVEPKYTFNPIRDKEPFPIENRMIEGHLQNFQVLSRYLSQFSKESEFYEAACDFHLLTYISNMEMLPMKDSLGPLLAAIKRRNREEAAMWAETCEAWATLEELISLQSNHQHQENVTPAVAQLPREVDLQPWPCDYCTFENQITSQSCEMCGLPKNGQ